VGRRRTCSCGTCAKCKDRIAKKAAYDAMTPAERRAWKKRKDPVKRYINDRKARTKHERKYPEKAKARDELQRAVRAGKVTKGPCEVCGTTQNVQGHHPDYTKPLEVQWLCTTHHRPPWTTDRG
jgi:hypothetical protein